MRIKDRRGIGKQENFNTVTCVLAVARKDGLFGATVKEGCREFVKNINHSNPKTRTRTLRITGKEKNEET